nr:TonB-dependent receptor [Pseudoduganella umbonata]
MPPTGVHCGAVAFGQITIYADRNPAIGTDDGSVVAPNRVPSYSLWGMSAAWQASRALKVRAGVQNMFDRSPPYSTRRTTSFQAATRRTRTRAAAVSMRV